MGAGEGLQFKRGETILRALDWRLVVEKAGTVSQYRD